MIVKPAEKPHRLVVIRIVNDAERREKERRWHLRDVIGDVVTDEGVDAGLLQDRPEQAHSRVVLIDEDFSH